MQFGTKGAVEIGRQLGLADRFTVQPVGLALMRGFQQHLGISEGKLVAGGIAAFAIACAIGDCAAFPVMFEIVDIRLDIDAVAADRPVETARTDVSLGLAVALHNRGKGGAALDALNAGIDDLFDAAATRCLDNIAMLPDPFVGIGHAGNQQQCVDTGQRCRQLLAVGIIAGADLDAEPGSLFRRAGQTYNRFIRHLQQGTDDGAAQLSGCCVYGDGHGVFPQLG